MRFLPEAFSPLAHNGKTKPRDIKGRNLSTFKAFFTGLHLAQPVVRSRAKWWLTLPLLLGLSSVQAEIKTFHGGKQVNQLLELYTSEGCSSCPPAERWLGNLQNQMGLWSDYVPVAFHVDYWDYLGWRDMFAKKANTQRQRTHYKRGNISQIYTPGFVVHGKEWRGFFRGSQPPMSNAIAPGDLSARIDTDARSATIHYLPHSPSNTTYALHFALLGFDIKNKIGGGENRGRRLMHNFVVLDHHVSEHTAPKDQVSWELSWQAPQDVRAKRWAIAAWVEDASAQMPLQATGGWIPNPL